MRFITLIITFVLTTTLFSQTHPDTIFRNLKDGAVLVRLKSGKTVTNKILAKNELYKNELNNLDASEDSNQVKTIKSKIQHNKNLIAKINSKQNDRNNEIINAFSSSFSYCDVYYFYEEHSSTILDGKLINVLLDSGLNAIRDVSYLKNNYLIAEFNMTHENRDTVHLGDVRYPNRNSEGKLYGEDVVVSVSTDMEGGVDALVLFTPDFKELQSPYPYYVRTFERLPFIGRTKERTVELLQFKIEKYVDEWLK